MSRQARKERSPRRNGSAKRNRVDNVYHIEPMRVEHWQPTAKELKPKNTEQAAYINMVKNATVTVAIGEPGTGKTFIPSVLAAEELVDPRSVFENIILIRPNEPLGKSLGMLPGDLHEKLEPWLEPIADGIRWSIGDKAYQGLVERKVIKPLAVEHARGRTFNNSFVILDEAQNIGVEAMMCILTRIGQDCRLVICGDIAQKDIKENSGLALLMEISAEYEHIPFNMIELKENVRSPESSAFYSIFKDKGLV
ncbi:hypothetical protein [Bacteriophage Eos]|nr:hypothetical protein [Bacteriophage Eos]